jgi:uncharacterized Zn-finger protein
MNEGGAVMDFDMEGTEKVNKKIVTAKRGIKSIVMPIQCPACAEEFQHEVELSNAERLNDEETIEIKAVCPHCSFALKGTIQKDFYQCDYCNRRFETDGEKEDHQKQCVLKK